jgi:RNA polymerase sigma-70 factor (ECF subfamily)
MTHLDEESEQVLLERLRAGQEESYESLVRRYGPRMRASALRLLGNPDDADDAVQEAFLSAFRSLERFERKARLGTWLQRIAINVALMRLRKGTRPLHGDLEELMPTFSSVGTFSEAQRSWSEAPEDLLEREELSDLVRRRIAQLPEKYRNPLLMHHIEGLSHQETADELGISVNAVKLRVHRGRQALRTLLHDHFFAA